MDKEINIKMCKNCNSYFYRGKWVKKQNLKNVDIPEKIELISCKNCSKKNPNYVEGILQLRNPEKEAVNFIKNDVKKQNKKGVYINKIKYLDNGVDFYLSNQTYLKVLAGKVLENFGGIIKKNFQLFSFNNQTSKNIFRLNLLLELPDYKKNEVIKIKDKLYKINSLKKKISVTELKTGKKTSLEYDEIKNCEIISPFNTRIIKVYPEFQVMNENYEPVKLKNPEKNLKENQKVNVVFDENIAYLV